LIFNKYQFFSQTAKEMDLKKVFKTNYFKEAAKIALIYFAWICLHYFSPHLYSYFCVPKTIAGFLASPFLATAPHCQALRWSIYTGANQILAMWTTFGSWLIMKMALKV
jgi:hypothetical protein